MHCRLFDKEDFGELCSWFREHDMRPPTWEVLPTTGFIVPGIAAGFLYVTDSSVGIIDMLVSNPDAGPKERDLALDLIGKHLIAEAKQMECEVLKCDTQLNGVRKRAMKHGFRYLGEYSTFWMEL